MDRKDFTVVICVLALLMMFYASNYYIGSPTGMQIQGIGELLIVGTGFLTNDGCTIDSSGKIDIKTYLLPGSVFKGNEDSDVHLRMFCGACINDMCEKTGIVNGYVTDTTIELCQPVGDSC
tara:strand:- start:320 stop:682 length:363 start_codon:yes stop_codon:yes gene_type:complete